MIIKNTHLNSSLNWFVLYTKSCSEKIAIDALRQKDLEVYYLMRDTKRKWLDQYKWVKELLFGSYCFVRVREEDCSRVFGVLDVVRYLVLLSKPTVLRNDETEGSQLMLSNFNHYHIVLRELDVHDQIEVKI